MEGGVFEEVFRVERLASLWTRMVLLDPVGNGFSLIVVTIFSANRVAHELLSDRALVAHRCLGL